MKLRLFVPFPFVAFLLSACGGQGNPTGPDMTSPPTNGTVLTFVSGDLDAGIAGVAVNVAGQPTRVTDASGQVSFDQALAPNAPYDAVVPGYLPRNSMIRSGRLSLIPVRPGFDETFIQQLVFNEFMPGRRLTRPAQNTVFLRLSDQIANDWQAKDAHEQAVRIATGATGGVVTFVISDSPPAGAVVYNVTVNPSQATSGQTTSNFSGSKIVGGKIEYRRMGEFGASFVPLVAHELGHTLGLGHPTAPGLMTIGSTMQDFTPAEKLALSIYLSQRWPGTVYPDNDRNAQALDSQRSTITVGCGQ